MNVNQKPWSRMSCSPTCLVHGRQQRKVLATHRTLNQSMQRIFAFESRDRRTSRKVGEPNSRWTGVVGSRCRSISSTKAYRKKTHILSICHHRAYSLIGNGIECIEASLLFTALPFECKFDEFRMPEILTKDKAWSKQSIWFAEYLSSAGTSLIDEYFSFSIESESLLSFSIKYIGSSSIVSERLGWPPMSVWSVTKKMVRILSAQLNENEHVVDWRKNDGRLSISVPPAKWSSWREVLVGSKTGKGVNWWCWLIERSLSDVGESGTGVASDIRVDISTTSSISFVGWSDLRVRGLFLRLGD